MSIQERTKRANPYRRAIAMAIHLERMHDALARISGNSTHLDDRIVPEGSRKGDRRRERMNLPRRMTIESMNDISDRRMRALTTVASDIGGTMGCGVTLVDAIIDEESERNTSDLRYTAEKRGPSRQMDSDDRMTFNQMMRRDIERAADAPVTVEATQPPLTERDERRDRLSISIDLMTEGLLDYYGIDRARLHGEIMRHYEAIGNHDVSRSLSSPARRSNRIPALASLGMDFPSVVFTLRGLSLDVVEMEMAVDPNGDPRDVWQYRTGSVSGRTREAPKLTRMGGMQGYDLFDFPHRALRDLTGDIRFHDALVVDAAERREVTPENVNDSDVRTVISLRRAYSHIDPPGAAEGRRPRIVRPSDVRRPEQARLPEHRDLDWARMINRLLNEAGETQRRTIRLIEGVGLQLHIADPGDDRLAHKYDFKRDTLDDGEDGVRGRVTDVIIKMRKQRSKAGAVRNPLPLSGLRAATTGGETGNSSPGTDGVEKVTDSASSDGPGADADVMTRGEIAAAEAVVRDRRTVFAAAFGDDGVGQWDACGRTDVLLSDLLADASFPDDDVPDLHMQEGTLAVHRMRLGPEMTYRLEKFDRVMGRPTHAVGTIEVARDLTSSTIEALRDGTVRILIRKWPAFAGAQVRKVSRCEGATMVTIRMPLIDRP